MSSVRRGQLALLLPTAKTLAALTATSCARRVLDGHVVEIARPPLQQEALNSDTEQGCLDDVARAAGKVGATQTAIGPRRVPNVGRRVGPNPHRRLGRPLGADEVRAA